MEHVQFDYINGLRPSDIDKIGVPQKSKKSVKKFWNMKSTLLAFSAHIILKYSMELRQFLIINMYFSYLSQIIGVQVDLF
jgi:hypothetical protein